MNQIETALKSLYKNKKYGELSSLYKLFDEKLANAIASQLSKDLVLYDSPRAFEKIYVDFQWIDKIPLASFVRKQKDINGNIINNKTEIGDFFIQYRHSNAYGNEYKSGIHQYCHRSLVIQAKLADTDKPVVPIGRISKNKANSTSKELKLLQDWPEFDLYETSGNKYPISKGVTVTTGKVPFAFYGGFTNASKTWSFGVAKNGEICQKSFSEIILELANSDAGKEVDSDRGWEIISFEINKICNNRKLPKSIAKKIESRNKTNSIQSGIIHSFPAQIDELIAWVTNKLSSIFYRRKMLVLTIDRVSYEGSEMMKHR